MSFLEEKKIEQVFLSERENWSYRKIAGAHQSRWERVVRKFNVKLMYLVHVNFAKPIDFALQIVEITLRMLLIDIVIN